LQIQTRRLGEMNINSLTLDTPSLIFSGYSCQDFRREALGPVSMTADTTVTMNTLSHLPPMQREPVIEVVGRTNIKATIIKVQPINKPLNPGSPCFRFSVTNAGLVTVSPFLIPGKFLVPVAVKRPPIYLFPTRSTDIKKPVTTCPVFPKFRGRKGAVAFVTYLGCHRLLLDRRLQHASPVRTRVHRDVGLQQRANRTVGQKTR